MSTDIGDYYTVPDDKVAEFRMHEYEQMHEYMRLHLKTMARSTSFLLVFLGISFGIGVSNVDNRVHPIVAPTVLLATLYLSQLWLVIQLVAKYTARLEQNLRDRRGQKLLHWESEIMSKSIYDIIVRRDPAARGILNPFLLFIVALALVVLSILTYTIVSSFAVVSGWFGWGWAVRYVVVMPILTVVTLLYAMDVFARGSQIAAEIVGVSVGFRGAESLGNESLKHKWAFRINRFGPRAGRTAGTGKWHPSVRDVWITGLLPLSGAFITAVAVVLVNPAILGAVFDTSITVNQRAEPNLSGTGYSDMSTFTTFEDSNSQGEIGDDPQDRVAKLFLSFYTGDIEGRVTKADLSLPCTVHGDPSGFGKLTIKPFQYGKYRENPNLDYFNQRFTNNMRIDSAGGVSFTDNSDAFSACDLDNALSFAAGGDDLSDIVNTAVSTKQLRVQFVIYFEGNSINSNGLLDGLSINAPPELRLTYKPE